MFKIVRKSMVRLDCKSVFILFKYLNRVILLLLMVLPISMVKLERNSLNKNEIIYTFNIIVTYGTSLIRPPPPREGVEERAGSFLKYIDMAWIGDLNLCTQVQKHPTAPWPCGTSTSA